MLTWCDCYAPVIGRVLMGGYFLWSGLLKMAAFSSTVAMVAAAGMPYPTVGAEISVAVEVVLGIMLILGWRTRRTALWLSLWTILVTFVYYSDFSQPLTMALFLKNLAIMGGLLYMSAFGSGGWSLENRKTST